MALRLFVYGTLKHGSSQHAALCARVRTIERAWARGRLYLHDDGYPALIVRPADVLAIATGSRACDARALRDVARDVDGVRRELLEIPLDPHVADALAGGAGGTEHVEGELLTFAAGGASLAALDAYEGCVPGQPSLFARVMVRVNLSEGAPPRSAKAWTYAAGAAMAAPHLTRASRWPLAPPA